MDADPLPPPLRNRFVQTWKPVLLLAISGSLSARPEARPLSFAYAVNAPNKPEVSEDEVQRAACWLFKRIG